MITKEDVLVEFDYQDGLLVRRKTGKPGYLRPDGYRYTELKGRAYGEHRLVYLMFHGYLPEQVDHSNGVRSDNRIENLRAATNAQNSMNRKGRRKGCYFQQKRNKWMVQIGVSGKRKTIGYFESLDLARSAYAEASAKYHKEFGRAE